MFKNILFFNSLITPKILTMLYWLSLLTLIVAGIATMVTHNIFVGLVMLIFGGMGIRVSFEMIMIAFKNNEYLKKIAEKP